MRVMIRRTKMIGGCPATSYDVHVPFEDSPNRKVSYFTVIDGVDYVSLADALLPAAHYEMPLGLERYQDRNEHEKRVRLIAYDLASGLFPELREVGYLPSLWTTKIAGFESKTRWTEYDPKDAEILEFIRVRPGVDIGQIAIETGLRRGPSEDPLSGELNRALVRLRDAGAIRTNNQWGEPRFFIAEVQSNA